MGTKALLDQPLVPEQTPKTADSAVDVIINEMHLKDRALLANLREEEIPPLQLTLVLYIKNKLDIWCDDETFCQSCVVAAERKKLDTSNLTMVLIKMIWKKLRNTHRLRVVK